MNAREVLGTYVGAVSVITPVFNSAEWLTSTLEAVRNQTIKDWEHILVDDCSTDRSVDIIKKAAAKDRRITLIRMPANGGPARARNLGIEAANGRYLAFLDADDLWLPKKLEHSIGFMQQGDYAFIYHDYRHMSHDGTTVGPVIHGPNRLDYRLLHTRRGTGGCCTVVIDRRQISGFHFPVVEKDLPEDFLAWAWILQQGFKGYRLPEDLARYRLARQSRSSNKFAAARAVWKLYRHHQHLPLSTAASWWTQYAWRTFNLHRRAKPCEQVSCRDEHQNHTEEESNTLITQ